MNTSYAAVLRDGRIEWVGDPPPGLSPDQPVRVQVTLIDPSRSEASGARLAAILQRIADAGGLTSIPDPDAWDRERREDRPLPGRES